MVTVKDSLSFTESGDNPNAWRRNKDGREFVGQWQFGKDRLSELGLGSDFTMEQFRNDPELQSRVMDMHVDDFNRRIEKDGLSAYEGTTVGGVPITRGSLIAMAHLGGYGGMRQFLKTDGGYNPQDELGTSLSDYALRHGGPTRASTEEARTNKLSSFAASADERALGLRNTAERVVAGGFSTLLDDGAVNAAPGVRAMAPQISFPAHQGVMPPAGPLGFGNAVPPGADPFTAQGMPQPIRMGATQLGFDNAPPPDAGGAPGGFSIDPSGTAGYSMGDMATRGASMGGEQEAGTEEDPARPGFLSRIGAAIFGEDEEDPDGKFKTLLGGLGVGLGQMSAGMPVDLQPYFANIAAQKQAVIEGERAAREAAVQQELDFMNADTARLNAQTAYAKFQAEVAGNNAELGAIYTPEQLEGFAQDPATAPFVGMINSGNKEAMKQGLDGIRQVTVDRAKQASEKTGSRLGDLYEAVANDAPIEEIADILADGNLTTADLTGVSTQLGKTPTGNSKDLDEYLDDLQNNPARAEVQRERWRLESGVDETPRERADREWAYKKMDELDQVSLDGREIYAQLLDMERITEQLLANNIETGPFNEQATWIANAITQVVGPASSSFFQEVTGIDADAFNALDNSEKTLALLIGGAMMKGGGSISDGEREIMAKTVAQGNTTNEQRLEILQRLKATYRLDQVLADRFGEQLGDDFGKARNLSRSLEKSAAEILPELRRSSVAIAGYRNKDRSDVYKKYNDMPMAERVILGAPRLTQYQHDNFRDAFETDERGRLIWARVNNDGSVTYMLDDKEITGVEGLNDG